jgi:ketosteroid isomerase-like protein
MQLSAHLLAALIASAAAIPLIELPPELDRVLRDYETAWRAHDAAALAGLFTDDGFVLAADSPPVRGRAAIQGAYSGAGGSLVLRAYAFYVAGDLGVIVGGFSRKPGEPDIGKFTLTLRKGADGRWSIFSDMDNGVERRR